MPDLLSTPTQRQVSKYNGLWPRRCENRSSAVAGGLARHATQLAARRYAIKRRALITGIGGQDGSYLAELLLSKDYEVFGMIPRRSHPQSQTIRIQHICDRLQLEYGDVLDLPSVIRLIKLVQPDEIYHLAAQSHVQVSFTEPVLTTAVIVTGTLNMLEATADFSPQARFYHAASSEIFGNSPDYPINE